LKLDFEKIEFQNRGIFLKIEFQNRGIFLNSLEKEAKCWIF